MFASSLRYRQIAAALFGLFLSLLSAAPEVARADACGRKWPIAIGSALAHIVARPAGSS